MITSPINYLFLITFNNYTQFKKCHSNKRNK